MNFKYIVVEVMGMESIIIFPGWIQHNTINFVGQIISAGFINNGKCYGSSHSLKLHSRNEDQILLNHAMMICNTTSN